MHRDWRFHVRGPGGEYRQAPESAAFPGWTEDEVYRALTEEPLSAASWQVLERVGRMLGEREGTTPEDDPLIRSLQARGEARASADAVVAALRARGIDVPADVAADPDLLCGCSVETAIAIALRCADAEDFRRRIRQAAG